MMITPNARVRIRMLAAVATAACMPWAAQAQDNYPTRPVTVVVPFSPGGGTDIAARLLATQLARATGQSFVVENRPGAAGQIAADVVARATPDGYTVLFANSGMLAINPWLYKLQSDPEKAFAPVAMFCDLPFALVVSPKLAANSVAEVIALAKSDPGKYTFASSGTGGAPHMAGEVFQQSTGTTLMHVPYKGGGPAMTDLIAGHVDMLFASVLETTSHVNSGNLRALAVTGEQRSPVMKNVPTLDEAGVKDANAGSWTAVMAPKGTPKAVVDKLSQLVRDAADNPEVKKNLIEQGAIAHGSTPEELMKIAAQDRARYGKIIETRKLSVNQ